MAIKIILPDGTEKEGVSYETTPMEIAKVGGRGEGEGLTTVVETVSRFISDTFLVFVMLGRRESAMITPRYGNLSFAAIHGVSLTFPVEHPFALLCHAVLSDAPYRASARTLRRKS